MFVGTSNAVRIKALQQIGGLYDSITEDMATGFEMHRARNPVTGKKWKSVYTPDVLAVGEGPSAWTDFFTQQLRWSRGTYETILKQYWKGFFSMPPGKLFNYTMMIIFYPMSALNWILAALSCALFLGLGASGVNIDPTVWLNQEGGAAGLVGGLGEALGFRLRVLRADPLAGRLFGDLPDLLGVGRLARVDVSGHLAGRVGVRVDPDRVGSIGLLGDLRARVGFPAPVPRGGTARHQQCRPQDQRRRPCAEGDRGPLAAVHPTPPWLYRSKSQS